MLAQSKGQAAFGGLLGARGAEEASFYGQVGAAGTKRQIESQTDEQRRQRTLQAQLQDLVRQRGAAGSEFMRKGRAEERQYAAEAKAFGLKVGETQAKADAARLANKRNRQLARMKARLERERAKGAAGDAKEIARLKGQIRDAYKPPYGGGGGGGKGKGKAGSTDFQYAISKGQGFLKSAGEVPNNLIGKSKKKGAAKRIAFARDLQSKFGLEYQTALKAAQYLAFVQNPKVKPATRRFWKKKLGVKR
jgi:hypothetical protein